MTYVIALKNETQYYIIMTLKIAKNFLKLHEKQIYFLIIFSKQI